MTNPVDRKMYTLRTTDRAGNSYYRSCLCWVELKFWVHVSRGKDVVLDLFGEDYDLDWDGLTDQEREDFSDLTNNR